MDSTAFDLAALGMSTALGSPRDSPGRSDSDVLVFGARGPEVVRLQVNLASGTVDRITAREGRPRADDVVPVAGVLAATALPAAGLTMLDPVDGSPLAAVPFDVDLDTFMSGGVAVVDGHHVVTASEEAGMLVLRRVDVVSGEIDIFDGSGLPAAMPEVCVTGTRVAVTTPAGLAIAELDDLDAPTLIGEAGGDRVACHGDQILVASTADPSINRVDPSDGSVLPAWQLDADGAAALLTEVDETSVLLDMDRRLLRCAGEGCEHIASLDGFARDAVALDDDLVLLPLFETGEVQVVSLSTGEIVAHGAGPVFPEAVVHAADD